jgi:alpha/beta superfamily hydrolase
MEKKVFFESDGLKLVGFLNKGENDKGVVITHPHPLYGGDMHNYVVESIRKVYIEKGYTTLRFNFRGVGESQGNYDNDRGEQEDLRSALSFITSTGIKQIELAGYSYGAWINSLAASKGASIKNIVLLSPPVAFIDFKPVTSIPGLKLVVTGSIDDYAPPDLLKKVLPVWNKKAVLEIINGADHFYGGCTKKLESVLSKFI